MYPREKEATPMDERRSTADRGFSIEGEKDSPLTTIPYPRRRRKEISRAAMLNEDTGTSGLGKMRSSLQLHVLEEHKDHAEKGTGDVKEEFHGGGRGEDLREPRKIVQKVHDGNLT